VKERRFWDCCRYWRLRRGSRAFKAWSNILSIYRPLATCGIRCISI